MFGLGVTEIVVILVIALIFLGPKKLPGLAKGLGKGMRNFQDALRGIENEINQPDEKPEVLPDVPNDDDLHADSGYQPHSDIEKDHAEATTPTQNSQNNHTDKKKG